MDPRLCDLRQLMPCRSINKLLLVGIEDSTFIAKIGGFARHVHQAKMEDVKGLSECSFDMAWVFCEEFVSRYDIEALHRVLASGGGVCMIMGPKRYRNAFGDRRMGLRFCRKMEEVGFSAPRLYGLSPSLEDFRIVAPLESNRLNAASLALYQPSLAKAKLLKRTAYLLSICGLGSIWNRFTLIMSNRGTGYANVLLKHVRSAFGAEAKFAMFTGTPGYLRKPTLQIMDSEGAILGYGKIGENPQVVRLIENEAKMLKFLEGFDFEAATVPRLICSVSIALEGSFLVQSSCKKPLSSAPKELTRHHAAFLTSLFHQTKTQLILDNSQCVSEVSSRTRKTCRKVQHAWMDLLVRCLKGSLATLSKRRLPMGVAHRDFTPWNTFQAGGRLFVFDWEFGREQWLPLTDAFHFVIQRSVLVDRENPEMIWWRLFSEDSSEAGFITRMCLEQGIDRDMVVSLLAFYLCDVSTSYLDSYFRQGYMEQDGRHLLACWKALLSRIMALETW